jgi:hypothetical protein
MTKKKPEPEKPWADPDDAPAWSENGFERAEIALRSKVLRPETGTLTKRHKGSSPKHSPMNCSQSAGPRIGYSFVMSDPPTPTTEQTTSPKPLHVDHYLEDRDCKSWGALGSRDGDRVRWVCLEHRGEKGQRPAAAPSVNARLV